MTRFRLFLSVGAAAALCALASPGAAQPAPSPAAKAAQAAKAAPPAAAKPAADLEPEAMQALKRMSAYLGTLTAFEMKADTSLDLVLDDGQKVQVDSETKYKVRRPNGFIIETSNPRKSRTFIYDGKTLTLYAPKLGYYAKVDAPPTIRQTLDAVYEKYGLSLPLEDLFRWSEPGAEDRTSLLQEAFVVGAATIDGVETDQYAFRQGDLDWQIWIERGEKPLPRKVVIVDRSDDAQPAYTARMTWNTSPQLAADAFAFTPPKDVMAIRMTASR